MESTAVKPEVQKLASSVMDQKLSRSPGKIAMIVFGCAIAAGIIYAGLKLGSDLATTHYPTAWPYVLLGVALLIALGFEFVNGFHDTANAVATVIYTHSLEPHVAVVWSGICNLTGVLFSSGAVAFAATRGIDSARGIECRLRDGLCPADLGDIVESGHVVAGAAGIEFAYADRLDHRCGSFQSISRCEVGRRDGHERCGLGADYQRLQGAAHLAAGRLLLLCAAAASL
jgi:hypothetical protein